MMFRAFRLIRQHTMPYYQIEKEVSPGYLRSMITTFSNHSGLCYAIMCGVSGAALLTPSEKLTRQNNDNNPSSHNYIKLLTPSYIITHRLNKKCRCLFRICFFVFSSFVFLILQETLLFLSSSKSCFKSSRGFEMVGGP